MDNENDNNNDEFLNIINPASLSDFIDGDDPETDTPEPPAPSPPANNDDVNFLRAELAEMRSRIETSVARLEVYEFQNEALRKELEQYKLDTLLHKLNRTAAPDISQEPTPFEILFPDLQPSNAPKIPESDDLQIEELYPSNAWFPDFDPNSYWELAVLNNMPAQDVEPAPEAASVDIPPVEIPIAASIENVEGIKTNLRTAIKTIQSLIDEKQISAIMFPVEQSEPEPVPLCETTKWISELDALRHALADAENDKSRVDSVLESSRNDNIALREQMQIKLDELKFLQSYTEEMRTKLEDMERVAAAERSQSDDLRDEFNKVRCELEKANSEMETMRLTITAMTARIDNLQEDTRQDRIDRERFEKENLHLQKSIAEIASARDALANERGRYLEERDKFAAELMMIRSQIRKLDAASKPTAESEMQNPTSDVMKILDRAVQERTRMFSSLREREDMILRLQKEVSKARESLVKTSLRPTLSIPVTQKIPDNTFENALREKLEAFENDPNQNTLFGLRSLFIEEKLFERGIRVFRQCFAKPQFQKFLPAICLIVGEFYKQLGNDTEANFYLTNPMIRNDSFAMYLMRTMNIQP